jgi:hypothetical protein
MRPESPKSLCESSNRPGQNVYSQRIPLFFSQKRNQNLLSACLSSSVLKIPFEKNPEHVCITKTGRCALRREHHRSCCARWPLSWLVCLLRFARSRNPGSRRWILRPSSKGAFPCILTQCIHCVSTFVHTSLWHAFGMTNPLMHTQVWKSYSHLDHFLLQSVFKRFIDAP